MAGKLAALIRIKINFFLPGALNSLRHSEEEPLKVGRT
jgi:hypothetical protein